MVRGQAEINLGYGTVLMIPCRNNDDGRYGLIFRSREPSGDVTEKEMEAVNKAIDNGDFDAILTFKSPKNIDKLIEILQIVKDEIESELEKKDD